MALKVDLHTHTSDDPLDVIPYSTAELIARAAERGLDAVAITLHDKQRDLRDLTNYAKRLGIVLISGVERTIMGRHVLLLNFPSIADSVESFEDVAALKARHPDGLVVAPHPFFPHPTCLRSLMDRHSDLFDAVEVNAFYTAAIDFNRKAMRWAAAHGKPIVANSDAHRLMLVGKGCSIVDAEPNATAICNAIRAGRVDIETRPLSVFEAGSYIASMAVSDVRAVARGRGLPKRAPQGAVA